MDQFHLDFILDKKIRRRIMLLKALSEAKYALTLAELSRELNVTKRTVLTDIQEFKDSSPTYIDIRTIAGVGYELEIYPPTAENPNPLNFYFSSMTAEIPLFIIIKSIFREDELLNLHEWATDLSMSTTTLTRHTNH